MPQRTEVIRNAEKSRRCNDQRSCNMAAGDIRCACVQAVDGDCRYIVTKPQVRNVDSALHSARSPEAAGSGRFVNLAPEAVDIVDAPALAHGRKPIIHPGIRRQCLAIRQIAIYPRHLDCVVVIQLLHQERTAMAFVGAKGLSQSLA